MNNKIAYKIKYKLLNLALLKIPATDTSHLTLYLADKAWFPCFPTIAHLERLNQLSACPKAQSQDSV